MTLSAHDVRILTALKAFCRARFSSVSLGESSILLAKAWKINKIIPSPASLLQNAPEQVLSRYDQMSSPADEDIAGEPLDTAHRKLALLSIMNLSWFVSDILRIILYILLHAVLLEIHYD